MRRGSIELSTCGVFLGFALLMGCRSQVADPLCPRMQALCGLDATACASAISEARQLMGTSGVDSLRKCFGDSASCAEATGCAAGVGLSKAKKAADGFLDGLKKGLEQQKEP